jgi:hypothetical protein
MATFGRKKVPIITIPKDVLIFRVVENHMTDFIGVPVKDGTCISPQYNVFFYFNPFAAEIFSKYFTHIPNIQVYKLKHDVKIVSLISPSNLTRSSKHDERGIIKRCDKTRKSCLKPKGYDACLSDTFVKNYPDIVGNIALAAKDSAILNLKMNKGTLKNVKHHIHLVSDSRGIKGSPELSLYPLSKRQTSSINITDPVEWMKTQDFNYEHVATLPRDKNALVNFLNTNTKFVSGKWYSKYSPKPYHTKQ